MSNKMTSFFKPKATEPEPEMLHWKTTKPRGPGSTARIEVFVKARVGSYVTHAVHGKVKLLGQPAPDKLEVEIKTDTSQWPVPGGIITMRNIVDALDCSDPVAIARVRDPSLYLAEDSAEMVADELVKQAIEDALKQSDQDLHNSARAAPKSKGKGKAMAVELPPTPPMESKKRGRPMGSKDSQPRPPRSASKVAWVYDGSKGTKGRQVAAIGDVVEHDGLGRAILLEQMDREHLQLQAGTDGLEYAVTVESAKCVAVEHLKETTQGGGSGAGGSNDDVISTKRKQKRKSGGRKRKELNEMDMKHGLNSLSTKAEMERVQKRQKREQIAAARGKPLKALKIQKNRKWPPALKDQAVQVYHTQFAVGEQWTACCNELLKLPGFVGLTAANLYSWVHVAAARAKQEPNEYGLIVVQNGRRPTIPAELYQELILVIQGLASTRAIRVCASSMRPVVLPMIIHRLGAAAIRPGTGGFVCGRTFLMKLARDAKLHWRKPYGDARKAPADADAQIADMVMRLAYLMKQHSIPRALVLNFDQTGLHFMQQRGNTFTVVEEDNAATHMSRKGKQKESKLKGLNDKRQATGTVGTSFAGDVCPGQLIVEGTPANHGALPDLDGCTYGKMRGSNPGHAVGWRLVQHGLDASSGRLERQWIGHLVQTNNHWANIQTSYAILEYIIIPWLLEKKKVVDKPHDHPAILIVDCWYGWKDQDKNKTLQSFRECTPLHRSMYQTTPPPKSHAHTVPLNLCVCRCA